MVATTDRGPASRTRSTDLPALTGLRAIAAFGVVATHAAYWTGHYTPDFVGYFLARLDFGVALFFVLSGFLLSRPWIMSLRDDADPPATSRYFIRRALRILPAYWVIVLIAFATVPSAKGTGFVALLRNLTLTQIYGDDLQHQGLTQMWSLAVEVSFYVILPLLGWLLVSGVCRGRWRPRRMLAVLALLVVANVCWVAVSHSSQALPASSALWLPGFISWFAVGMGLTVVVVAAPRTGSRLRRVVSYVEASPGAIWLLALAVFGIACTPIAGPTTLVPAAAGEAIAKNLLYAVCAGLIMLPLVLQPSGWPSRVLAHRRLVWLGGVSYEIFLVHLVVLEVVMHLFGYRLFTGTTVYVLAVTAALSVPVAWLLYQFVELPLRRFRR